MSDNNLTKEQVIDAVYAYQSHEVTSQLYEFGKMMLTEIGERGGKINSQATTVLAWATGVIAFLFAQLSQFNGASVYFAVVSAALALVAILCSFQALRTREEWQWPSDKSWIHKSATGSEDELKRFHIRVIHEVRQNHLSITEDKADWLFLAELFLMLAAFSLLGGIAYHVLSARLPWILALSENVQICVVQS